jgi:alpha-D-ribose 1-methylphosphonate 5-triphosphate synthase subunit PhnG
MNREDLNFMLQKANFENLKNLYEKISKTYEIKVLQAPVEQTLLIPIKDPISGGEFYAGEVLTTTSIVQVDSHKGWAMVQDFNEELSLYISVCDACFGAGYFIDEIESLVKETLENLEKFQKEMNKKINSTRVSFDLMN